jgi:lipopolysaccharide export system ATP-binding protein
MPVAPSAVPLLEVERVSVLLGGRMILDAIDVTVTSGTVVGIVGASGAGKSTLFRAIAGEVPVAGGQVRLSGKDVTPAALWQRARLGLGYVPQSPSVLFDLTVAENIDTFERAARVAREPIGARARTVELESRLGVRARDLSGGERRRLELLRALIADPRVLICDEPFAGGDPVHVRALGRLLRAHADRGRAILVADHRVADVLSICDDALFLADGNVLARGPAQSLPDHPAVRGRYLGVA